MNKPLVILKALQNQQIMKMLKWKNLLKLNNFEEASGNPEDQDT